jgi:CBS domain-containing protein
LELTYQRESYPELGPAEFIDLLVRSTLAERRPVDQPETIRGMLEHASVILTARAGGRLVGIFTERDVVLRILGARPAADPARPIREFMTPDPDALHPDSPLGVALELMERRRLHGVPLVDDKGMVAGHLDARDVLEYIAEAFPQEVLNLPPRPHQQLEQAEGA